MIPNNSIVAIYDFELFPYALGDVLTWNVRTAMRCEELGRERVDIYICADERYPAGIYQRGLVNEQNFDLFFNELYGAFGTHPRLGNIHIYRQREALIDRLQELVIEDPVNSEAVDDYLKVLNYRVLDSTSNKLRRTLFGGIRSVRLIRQVFNRSLPAKAKALVRDVCLPNEEVINNYFIKYIHSHESINVFAATRGAIPLLKPALGCLPDIEEIILRRFAGKKIVPFHLRLRRLDAGYGGEHSYIRDSDFIEWYDFLKEASIRYPEVQFVALGRLQEKPLELLRLPNVTSLRIYGMGLGHELTLMLRSDLFIGTSSGFAALANFSSIPYFITKMTPGSCHAYAIPEGADRLPFATDHQKLIYAQETSELLMSLLETGLKLESGSAVGSGAESELAPAHEIDVPGWLSERLQSTNFSATTCRFYTHDKYRDEETAYLLFPGLERARVALLGKARNDAHAILLRIENHFPILCGRLSQFILLKGIATSGDLDSEDVRATLETLDAQPSGFVGSVCSDKPDDEAGWRPVNWIVEGGEYKPLPEEIQPALSFRATSPNAYWHTERFVCDRQDGKITVCVDAKNSMKLSRQRLWVFEDGSYRSIGELAVLDDWRTFRIDMATKPGSVLEIQVDQSDDNQWLSIRDFKVIGVAPRPITTRERVAIPMASWTGGETSYVQAIDYGADDCRRWPVAGAKGYVQTPLLPQAGDGGLLISFEAHTDQLATMFTAVYLFEGEKYRKVAQYSFGTEWKNYSLVIHPDRTAPIKLQIDYPDSVNVLAIRSFFVTPVDAS